MGLGNKSCLTPFILGLGGQDFNECGLEDTVNEERG